MCVYPLGALSVYFQGWPKFPGFTSHTDLFRYRCACHSGYHRVISGASATQLEQDSLELNYQSPLATSDR